MTAVEVEIVVRPPRCSPASTQIPPRHPIAVGPALNSDPRAIWDEATLSRLVLVRDPTTYDGHRLHRIRPWTGEPQAGVVLRRVSIAPDEYGVAIYRMVSSADYRFAGVMIASSVWLPS